MVMAKDGEVAHSFQPLMGVSRSFFWRLMEAKWPIRRSRPELSRNNSHFEDGPEVHPTSYVRNALNIAALRLIGGGHEAFADEIELRFRSLRPSTAHITWHLGETIEVARVAVDEMIRSAEIAAEVLVSQTFPSLGGQSYRDLGDFTAEDQAIVDAMVSPLLDGDPTFAQADGATPRHALAATMLAFEKDRSRVATINRTFKHFV